MRFRLNSPAKQQRVWRMEKGWRPLKSPPQKILLSFIIHQVTDDLDEVQGVNATIVIGEDVIHRFRIAI